MLNSTVETLSFVNGRLKEGKLNEESARLQQEYSLGSKNVIVYKPDTIYDKNSKGFFLKKMEARFVDISIVPSEGKKGG